jgi:hypothetical protein
MDQNYNLHNNWCLWYHSIKDNSWSIDSYKNIAKVTSLFDYKVLQETIKSHHLYNGMLFLMKDNIYPVWEDPENREGGSLSFKIPCQNVKEEWDNVLLYCITEALTMNNDNINGISISPKKEFNILKIWLRQCKEEKDKNTIDFYGNYMIKENMIFRKHTPES